MRNLLVTGMVLVLAAAAHAGPDDQDRAIYRRLSSEVRQIDRDYAQVLAKATNDARANGGEASRELQANMLALQERRDRTMSRLLLLSLRHNWELPDFETPADAAGAKAADPVSQLLEPARRVIRGRFVIEAKRIASGLVLPVIPASSIGL